VNVPLLSAPQVGALSWVRQLAAVAIVVGGALHARLAYHSYGTHDLIILFFLNAIGSALVAGWIAYDRGPIPLVAGLGLTGVSLAAFGLSRVGDGVVGFRATGLDPAPDAALTLAAEALALGLLAAAIFACRGELRAMAHRLRAS
jgi:hypothetical protein